MTRIGDGPEKSNLFPSWTLHGQAWTPILPAPWREQVPPRAVAKDEQTPRQEARRDSAIIFLLLSIHAVSSTLCPCIYAATRALQYKYPSLFEIYQSSSITKLLFSPLSQGLVRQRSRARAFCSQLGCICNK